MVEFDKKLMEEYLSDRIDKVKEITGYLKRESVQELLNKNDFKSIYLGLVYRYESKILTCILLLSGIDFLSYMDIIPTGCFYDIPVTKINIPSNIEEIQEYAIYDCNDLHIVNVPHNVKLIESNNFEYCYNLEGVNYDGTCEEWNTIAADDEIATSTEVYCIDGPFWDWVVSPEEE